jgi:hypothetical protein
VWLMMGVGQVFAAEYLLGVSDPSETPGTVFVTFEYLSHFRFQWQIAHELC